MMETQALVEIAKLLLENQTSLLMDLQGDHCGCNGGKPKLVFRSPAAHRIGKLLKENESWLRNQ